MDALILITRVLKRIKMFKTYDKKSISQFISVATLGHGFPELQTGLSKYVIHNNCTYCVTKHWAMSI